jgi:PPOX class probable F420-dependent enzyme
VEEWVVAAVETPRVARLGTVDDDGGVRLVPICFAVVDGWLVGAVDHKPKRTGQLRRLDDMTGPGSATVLIDHYDDDWTQLWWVRIRGRAVVHPPGRSTGRRRAGRAVAKYEQYRRHPPVGARTARVRRGPVVALDP